MATTSGGARCDFCRLMVEHWAGCPAEIGTAEAEAIWKQAYDYAYWKHELRQYVLSKRSTTFLVGYMVGRSDRDFDDMENECWTFENKQSA